MKLAFVNEPVNSFVNPVDREAQIKAIGGC